MKPPARMDPEKVAGDLVSRLVDAAVDLDAFAARFVESDHTQVLEDGWRRILTEELGRLHLAPFLPAPARKPGRRAEAELVHSDLDTMRRYAELCLRGPEKARDVGFYFDAYSSDLVQALARSIVMLADVALERIRIAPPGGRNTKQDRRARRIIDALKKGKHGRLATAELMKRARLKDRQALVLAIGWANSRVLNNQSIVAVRRSAPGCSVVAYELVGRRNGAMMMPLPDGADLMFDQTTE